MHNNCFVFVCTTLIVDTQTRQKPDVNIAIMLCSSAKADAIFRSAGTMTIVVFNVDTNVQQFSTRSEPMCWF